MASFKFWENPNNDRTTKRTDNKRRMKLIRSYAPDWTITILLAIVFFALDGVHGFRRQFSVHDETILFPFAVQERVPNIALYFIAIVAPLVLQLVVNLLTVRSFWDYHCSALGLILGLAITGAITQFTKITVGRPRPDLLARCMPIPSSSNTTFGLSSDAICTNTDTAIMIDGWRSFPSGHSSLSHAGLGFLSYYLAGKMHLFDTRGHTHKAWISVAPIFGAILVAVSRTMDYRHHWEDVVAGSILGLVVSYFAYRQYFPSLSSPTSHKPHPPRVRREEELPTVNPATDHHNLSYTDGMEGEEVELVGGVRKPDPAFTGRQGEYGVDDDAPRL